MSDESLLDYVKRRLREEGAASWPAIAAESKKPLTTLRKLAYNDRKNPRLDTIEPVADVLRAREQAALLAASHAARAAAG